jgi:predicted  nucleic acid-binding Zn-ribbon protein
MAAKNKDKLFHERAKHEEELLKLRNDLEASNKKFIDNEKVNL